jgi:hypothetical protein
MADVIYNRGLDEFRDWTTGTYQFLLLKSSAGAANRDNDFVDDLVPGTNELSVATYARVTAASKTRTIDDTNDRITYDCADPNFGAAATGQTAGQMILNKRVTNDADSVLMVSYDIPDTATDGTDFIVTMNALGAAYTDQGA